MTRTALVSSIAALALLASAAEAKEITKIEVCGASGCRDVTHGVPREEVAFVSGKQVAVPERAAWYSVQLTIDTGGAPHEAFAMAYVPARRMLRTEGENPGEQSWFTMPERQVRAFERLVRGVRPYPAARLQVEDRPAAVAPPVTPPAPAAATAASGTVRESAAGGDGAGWWVAGGALALVLAGAGIWRTRRST